MLSSCSFSKALSLHIEQEIDDVSALHDVGLALASELARLADLGHRPGLDHVVVADDLGADEAAGDISVDRAGSLDGIGAAADGPRAALILANGEEGHQPE